MSSSGHGAPSQAHGGHGSGHGGGHGAHHSALAEFKEKNKAVNKLLDTITLHHSEAYNAAAAKHLMDADHLIDYSKLKDEDVQANMADEMSNFYVGKAREYFKIGDSKLSEAKQAMLVNAYAGTTQGELRQLFAANREDLTVEAYGQKVQEFKEKVAQALIPSASSHVKKHDLEAIVKEMGIADQIDPSKLRIQEAVGLMRSYEANGGVISQKTLERHPAYKGGHDAHAPAAAGHH